MPLLMGRLKILRTLTSFILGKNGGSDIKELREFRQLKGNLSVLKLEKVVDARDASKANLRDKLQLNESVLKWGGDTNDSKKDRDVLDQLQPHAISHQSKFVIVLPDQMHTLFPSLQTLSIWCCPELESFPEVVGILRKALLNGWPSGCTKDVLEKLVPRTNLNKLQIHNYGGTRFRCWLGYDSFCNIVSVLMN
nr:putative disease resistance rpp13-like protein 1 [Quercus suber]